jgi:competence protein ComEA
VHSEGGSRGTLAIWAIAVLLAGLVFVRPSACGRDASGGSTVQVSDGAGSAGPGGAASGSSASGASGAGASAGGLYVHVAGAVRQPGLLHLREGARVAEAVEQAGGPLPRADLAGVNLAAKLEDGQQVIVPVRGAVPGAPGTASPGTTLPGAASPATPGSPGVPKLSLGTVTVEQLDQLDGIGPTLAQRIVEYRTEHGGFRSLGELRDVEGIGEKRFEGLSEALQP